jgi:hypothetical protein
MLSVIYHALANLLAYLPMALVAVKFFELKRSRMMLLQRRNSFFNGEVEPARFVTLKLEFIPGLH